MTLFTIAIPTYNNQATISRSIESALAQRYEGDYEVLVVNNASKDETAAVIQGFSEHPKVRIVTNPETCSLFENHNVCFGEARGRYVVFCHADDTLDPGALDIFHRAIEFRGFPHRVALWGHSLYRDYYDNLRSSGFGTGQLFAGLAASRPFMAYGLSPSGTCYCKTFIGIGGFIPTKKSASPSDASSMVRAALAGFRFEMLQDIVLHRHDASTAVAGRKAKELVDAYRDAFEPLLATLDPSMIKALMKQASKNGSVPILFYGGASAMFPRAALKGLLKAALSHPSVLRKGIYRAAVVSATMRLFGSNPGVMDVG